MNETKSGSSAPHLGGADLFDLAVIKKYDKAGPRYTSYPTAPMFHDGVGHRAYAETLKLAAKADAPLSLYIHIP
ncbi:MAG TPA: hypothetical protein VKA31_10905, partial [Mariprofundaceae bacterium]|nr:hypothetical protein [Mariprofundaceae bacterium]